MCHYLLCGTRHVTELLSVLTYIPNMCAIWRIKGMYSHISNLNAICTLAGFVEVESISLGNNWQEFIAHS